MSGVTLPTAPNKAQDILPPGPPSVRTGVRLAVLLAAIAGALAVIAMAVAEGRPLQLEAGAEEVTIQTWGGRRGAEGPAEAATRAALVAKGVPGVQEARALSRAEMEAIVAPWFESGQVPEDAPMPGLVAVTLNPDVAFQPARLKRALRGAGLQAEVVAHTTAPAPPDPGRPWALAARAGAATATVLALLVAWTLGQTLVEARGHVLDVLHAVGAPQSGTARVVARRCAWLGARAGVWAFGVMVLAAGLAWSGSLLGLVPTEALSAPWSRLNLVVTLAVVLSPCWLALAAWVGGWRAAARYARGRAWAR